MNILIAPNSMKGSLSAFDFADIAEEAFLRFPGSFSVRKVPVADGGDNTGEVLRRSMGAVRFPVTVTGPFGDLVESGFYMSGTTAVIEMADASGMKLVKTDDLNPLNASSYGTGELILAATNAGCREILLAVGGSATVDGGAGMAEAMGFSFFDSYGNRIPGTGGTLAEIARIEKPHNLPEVTIKIITDVSNPLLGRNGAAVVFGPQKGASPEMVTLLEGGLKNWSDLIATACHRDFANLPGAGAAGGMAVPLLAFMHAEIVPGAAFVLESLNFKEHVMWADIVITGEGSVDSQTLADKAPFAVAQMSRLYGKPVFAFGGKINPDASSAFDGLFSICRGPSTVDEAITNARELLCQFTSEFAKMLQIVILFN